MRLLGLAAAIISFAAMTAAAQAAPGFATADVNLRTGPDIEFPSAGIIPEGAPIDVQGCLNDEILVRRHLGGKPRVGLQRISWL